VNYAPCGKHRFSGRNFEEIQSALVTTAEDGIRKKKLGGYPFTIPKWMVYDGKFYKKWMIWGVMWVKQDHKPPVWECNHTTNFMVIIRVNYQ
jgi:hypothetical protein